MEDEVVRIAKKMDKMVQKKNAVSAAGAAGPEGGRAAGGGRTRRASGRALGGPFLAGEAGGARAGVPGR